MVCGTKERNVASALAVCADCIRDRPAQVEAHIHRARTRSRVQLGLIIQRRDVGYHYLIERDGLMVRSRNWRTTDWYR